jgi:hypothetical protein
MQTATSQSCPTCATLGNHSGPTTDHSITYKGLADRILIISTHMQACIAEAASLEAALEDKPWRGSQRKRYADLAGVMDTYDALLWDVDKLPHNACISRVFPRVQA